MLIQQSSICFNVFLIAGVCMWTALSSQASKQLESSQVKRENEIIDSIINR